MEKDVPAAVGFLIWHWHWPKWFVQPGDAERESAPHLLTAIYHRRSLAGH